MVVVSNLSLIMAPWTNSRLHTHENLGTTPFLFMHTNKSYILSKKNFFNHLYHPIDAFWLNARSEENMQGECDEE